MYSFLEKLSEYDSGVYQITVIMFLSLAWMLGGSEPNLE